VKTMPSFYFQLQEGEGWLLLRESGPGIWSGTYVVGEVVVAQVDSGG